MAVKKLEVGKSYKWSDKDPDSDYFVVTNVGEDTFNYTYPTWNNGAGYSSASYYNNDSLEGLEDLEEFKVGDYLSEEAGDIVWKVTEVGEGGNLLTEALLIQDADDVVDTYRLGSVTLRTMKKATPEQIEAFENHPYWGKQAPVADAISPSVYQFPSGVEVRDISAHLTSFGGQAVQYVCRSTRLDGIVKGLPVQDLKKAIQLLEWEVERLES